MYMKSYEDTENKIITFIKAVAIKNIIICIEYFIYSDHPVYRSAYIMKNT